MEQREIKFRAWDTVNDRMVFEPYKFHPITKYQINTYLWKGDHVFYENWQDVDDGIDRPCFLMQYIGLKEIYESDIVSYNGERFSRMGFKKCQIFSCKDISKGTRYRSKSPSNTLGNSG